MEPIENTSDAAVRRPPGRLPRANDAYMSDLPPPYPAAAHFHRRGAATYPTFASASASPAFTFTTTTTATSRSGPAFPVETRLPACSSPPELVDSNVSSLAETKAPPFSAAAAFSASLRSAATRPSPPTSRTNARAAALSAPLTGSTLSGVALPATAPSPRANAWAADHLLSMRALAPPGKSLRRPSSSATVAAPHVAGSSPAALTPSGTSRGLIVLRTPSPLASVTATPPPPPRSYSPNSETVFSGDIVLFFFTLVCIGYGIKHKQIISNWPVVVSNDLIVLWTLSTGILCVGVMATASIIPSVYNKKLSAVASRMSLMMASFCMQMTMASFMMTWVGFALVISSALVTVCMMGYVWKKGHPESANALASCVKFLLECCKDLRWSGKVHRSADRQVSDSADSPVCNFV